ncbi:hypothetical protein K0B96_00240 [Horticoccus luteus]|uniref:Uncharacterized protein n=1 Tax=Horticoccus luteus TaxID=2862869 RepID=A0A8F9TTP9_9BACT|nr:hypothetical protein [Horticoccus luteus]QYM79079.1 hypothetical protein K0B96_00240 [Horticoccus luteus]
MRERFKLVKSPAALLPGYVARWATACFAACFPTPAMLMLEHGPDIRHMQE